MFRQNFKYLNYLSVLGFPKKKEKRNPSPFILKENTAIITKQKALTLSAYLSELSLKYMFLGDQRSDLVLNAINTEKTPIPRFGTVEKELTELMTLTNHQIKPDQKKLYQALFKCNQLSREKKPEKGCQTSKVTLFEMQFYNHERIHNRNIKVAFRFPDLPIRKPNKYDMEYKQLTLETFRSLSEKTKKMSAPLNTMVIAVNEGQVKDKDDESAKNEEPSKCTLLSYDDAVPYLMMFL